MARRIIRTCDIIMEVTWLLALVSIPIYFNIYTSRVFEPDKLTLFRSLVLIMLVAWAAKGLGFLAIDWEAARAGNNRKNRANEIPEIVYPADGEVIGPDSRGFPRNFLRRPLIPFALALSFIYLIATIFSVVPGVSWWGSYQRLQGTYTFLSYVSFFLVIVFNMRERRQVERLVSFVLLANVPVALYGLLQHFKADPLQWQGDVVIRVTSTMGNAIFISAYLIMVLPLIAYRAFTTGNWLLTNRAQANKYFKGRQRDTALSWVALYGCFMIFLIGVFFVVLNFNANYKPEQIAGVAQASDAAQLLGNDRAAAEARSLIGNESVGPWWALPVGILISFSLFFLFTVRRRGTDVNYLFRLFEFVAYLTLAVVVVLTIFFSQSRGPEVGMLVGLYIFFPLIFWRRKAKRWLIGWLAVGLIGGGVLLLFNLPAGSTPLEPIFKVARQNDQINRLSQLLEVNDGTGRVRQLIWKTVLETMGAAAQNEPWRLAIGYGPESLYNVSPQHYQPELAHVEARNAIPDRSHNGYLDALATTGVIGLAAYVILVLAFLFYALKFLRRTERFDYQVLLAALISLMIGHQIEIQTGIQIASTWMMFWTACAGVVVLGGLIYGRWDAIGAKKPATETEPMEFPAPVVVEEPEPVLAGKAATATGKAATATTAPKKGSNASKGKAAAANREREKEKEKAKELVNAASSNSSAPRSASTGLNRPGRRNGPYIANAFTEPEYNLIDRPIKGWFWAGVGAVALAALFYAWFGNILPILADTVYKQGSNLAQVNQWVRATPYLEQSAILAPSEDFYSLYLGQAYLEIAQTQTSDKTKMTYYLQKSEAELQRANKLAPLNPDHYANLARLYTRWADLEPARANEFLTKSIKYYKDDVTKYAPRNARLWSEYAAALASLATRGVDTSVAGGTNDKPTMDQAIQAAEQSVKLDNNYDFNRLVLGDIYRFAGKNDEAGEQYAALARIDAHQLASDDRFSLRMQALAQSKLVGPNEALAAFSASKSGFSLTPAIMGTLDTFGYDTTLRQASTDQGFTYSARGIIYYYQNNLEAANSNLNKGISLNPSDPYEHAYLSLVYKKLGQATQSQNEATQARSLVSQSQDPNKGNVQQAIERLLTTGQ